MARYLPLPVCLHSVSAMPESCSFANIFCLAADESLKFWKIFERKPGTSASASREGGVGSKAQMTKSMTIR